MLPLIKSTGADAHTHTHTHTHLTVLTVLTSSSSLSGLMLNSRGVFSPVVFLRRVEFPRNSLEFQFLEFQKEFRSHTSGCGLVAALQLDIPGV